MPSVDTSLIKSQSKIIEIHISDRFDPSYKSESTDQESTGKPFDSEWEVLAAKQLS